MCDPLTLGVAAVGTAFKVAGQVTEANAQKKAARENKANALAAFVENVRALNLRGTQEQDAAVQQIDQATQQSAVEKSQAALSAAEAGVTGASVDAQRQTLDRGLATFKDSTLQNLDRMLAQINSEKAQAATTAQSRINQVQAPSGLATALGIGSTIASGVEDIMVRRKPK